MLTAQMLWLKRTTRFVYRFDILLYCQSFLSITFSLHTQPFQLEAIMYNVDKTAGLTVANGVYILLNGRNLYRSSLMALIKPLKLG